MKCRSSVTVVVASTVVHGDTTKEGSGHMARLLHPIPEASDVLGGMSRSTLYEKIAGGEIKAVKVGRRTYIAHEELERFVQTLTGAVAGEAK